MKKNMQVAAVIVALLATTIVAAGQAKFTTANTAIVTVTGTSSLHDWKMQGSTIQGSIAVDQMFADALTPETWKAATVPPAVAVKIPVASVKSEHSRMDKLMQEALKAKTFPEISYEMTGGTVTKATADSFVVNTTGKLTIAGTTRDVEMVVNGTRTATENHYVLSTEVPIKMSAFGIRPPTAMMGTIKTGDDVKVSLRWVVARSN